jgi:hypothetical protein
MAERDLPASPPKEFEGVEVPALERAFPTDGERRAPPDVTLRADQAVVLR